MPHIVVRSITPDEIDDFLFVTRTVFAFPGGSLSPIQPQNTLAVFEDGDLVSTFNAWPFQWQLNGATINVAGISSVGTLPHRRRRGHLRRIITEAFRRQRQAGQSMSILWGSHAAIYQRFGYAVVAHDAAYQVHPRDIAFAVPPGLPTGPDSGPDIGPDTGDVQLSANPRPGSDRFDTLRAVYGAYIAGRTGEVQRDPGMWERGVLREDPREGPVYAAVYAQDHQAQGYALYTVRDGIYDERLSKHREPDESQRLTLRELVARTPAAYAALWRHIAAHDIVRWIHYENAPEDDPLFDLLQEPRMLRRATRDGIMARVIDLAAALPQRPYAAPAAVTLRIHDPDCDWNDGVWAFRTDGSRTAGGTATTVQPSDRAPQLSLSIHALACMITGYRSPSQLVRIGRAHAAPGLDLPALDRAFAIDHRPHCFQHF